MSDDLGPRPPSLVRSAVRRRTDRERTVLENLNLCFEIGDGVVRHDDVGVTDYIDSAYRMGLVIDEIVAPYYVVSRSVGGREVAIMVYGEDDDEPIFYPRDR